MRALIRSVTPDSYPPQWLWLMSETVAVAALIALLGSAATRHPRDAVRMIVLVWALSAFGLVHGMIDYVAMGILSTNNWDLPPGTGIGIVFVLIAGVVAAWLRPHPIISPPIDPDRDGMGDSWT